jgi:hypothetical protein
LEGPEVCFPPFPAISSSNDDAWNVVIFINLLLICFAGECIHRREELLKQGDEFWTDLQVVGTSEKMDEEDIMKV